MRFTTTARDDWVKVVDALPVQRSSTAFEFHPELCQLGPDFMHLRGRSGNEDLRPSSVVIGAGGVVHHRLLQGVPVLFTVVVLIDEHPDLLIRIVGRLPEPGTRPGVVVDLGMHALIVEYLGEELQRLAMIGLGDAEFHSVDLRHCRRLPSDIDTGQGIREPAEQRPFRGAKPDCGLLDPAVVAGHSNDGVAVGADAQSLVAPDEDGARGGHPVEATARSRTLGEDSRPILYRSLDQSIAKSFDDGIHPHCPHTWQSGWDR